MKTVTEFNGFTLRNASEAKAKIEQELQAAGKTPEELAQALPQALGEALKVEGDKLTLLLNALEAAGGKLNDLKRVVVWSLTEGEKPPQRALQKGEHYFGTEFFPPMHKKGAPAEQGAHGRGPKEGRDGKRHGKGRRGDRRDGERGGRGTRPKRPEGAAPLEAGAPTGTAGAEGEKRQRRPRGRRPSGPGTPGQKPQQGAPATGGIPGRIIPRAELEAMKAQATPPSEAPAAPQQTEENPSV